MIQQFNAKEGTSIFSLHFCHFDLTLSCHDQVNQIQLYKGDKSGAGAVSSCAGNSKLSLDNYLVFTDQSAEDHPISMPVFQLN